MTNLNLYSMPLIRYDTGDLGFAQTSERCSCGRGLSRLDRVEGRVVDTIKLRDGDTFSPYSFICRLETLEGLERFHILQDSYDHITVSVQSAPGASTRLEQDIRGIVKGIVSDRLDVTITKRETLHQSRNGKFRTVQSLV
jgi:phenylacetate-CoA ligase